MRATIHITPIASSAIKARARGTSASVTSCTARKIRSGEMCTVSEVTPRKRYSGRTQSNVLRVSRAATFPKCDSIRSASHNPIWRRYQAAERRRTARACWAAPVRRDSGLAGSPGLGGQHFAFHAWCRITGAAVSF
jgi:hypothetical protein